ncbi:MAG: hypothetical protein M3362_01765 [Acidobacteriota bacterium]|nr:hypothetical protein [Acidobacteriota bacterium]
MSKLPLTTHPSEIDDLSCSDLNRLTSAVGAARRELSFLNQDITRIRKYEKQLVVLIDFSELYTYLWPENAYSQHKVLIRHLFTNSALTFTLPPGAIRELIYELTRRRSEHRIVRQKVDELLSKPLVQAFVNAYRIPLSDETAPEQAPPGQVMSDVMTAVKAVKNADSSLELLARLYEDGRIKPLNDYVDPTKVIPNQGVLQDGYYQLASYRVNREDITNYIDAYNYAFTYSLNNKFYENGFFFLYVTSSPTPYRIFETIKWQEDPLFTAEAGHLMKASLVRSPAHLVYLSYLLNLGPGERLNIQEAMKDLEFLHETWNNLPIYSQYVTKKDIPGSTLVKLPRNQKYRQHLNRFFKFYQGVYRPLAELMSTDAAQEQNRRRLRRVDVTGIGGLQSLDQSEGSSRQTLTQPMVNYRSVLSLFDRLLSLSDTEIDRAKEAFKRSGGEHGADLDPDRLILQHDTLSLTTQRNDILECVEATAVLTPTSLPESPGSVYLCADVYEDYVSFWWRTNVDFSEFLKAARHFVRATKFWLETGGGGHTPTNKIKEFKGVYFHLANEVRSFSLEDIEQRLGDSPLSDSLIKLCEPHWDVRFVRIALQYGDLCYDMQAVGPFPQRAGIVTHLECAAIISDLIKWTNVRNAQRDLSHEIIRRIFGARETAGERSSKEFRKERDG